MAIPIFLELSGFFWDSQFGRFFNTGPITTSHPSVFHYFFFIHTFLWAFLPWSMAFIVAIWNIIKTWPNNITLAEKARYVYLLGSFIPTFVVFSLTSFQLDYYINILLPFAAIICANWFYMWRVKHGTKSHFLFYFQVWFAVILTLVVMILSIFVFKDGIRELIIILGLLMLLVFIVFIHDDDLKKALLYSTLSISLVFIFAMFIYGRIYIKYDAGYNIAKVLNLKPALPIVDYQVNSLTLAFYTQDNYIRVNNLKQLLQIQRPYYLVTQASNFSLLNQRLNDNLDILGYIKGATIDKVMHYLLTKPRLEASQTEYIMLEIQ